MHCVDCHFKQDNHGNGKLYGEPRAAIEIDCVDCHGTIAGRRDARDVAARRRRGHRPLGAARRPSASRASTSRRGKLIAAHHGDGRRRVGGAAGRRHRSRPAARATTRRRALAKTIQTDGTTWGDAGADARSSRTPTRKMTCYACHSSWITSCFGCHLSQKANAKKPMLHNEGGDEPQLDELQLPDPARRHLHARPRTARSPKNRIAPGALVQRRARRRSQNQNREWIYSQQQTGLRRAASAGRRSRPTSRTPCARTETQELHRLPRLRRPATTTPGWRSC